MNAPAVGLILCVVLVGLAIIWRVLKFSGQIDDDES